MRDLLIILQWCLMYSTVVKAIHQDIKADSETEKYINILLFTGKLHQHLKLYVLGLKDGFAKRAIFENYINPGTEVFLSTRTASNRGIFIKCLPCVPCISCSWICGQSENACM